MSSERVCEFALRGLVRAWRDPQPGPLPGGEGEWRFRARGAFPDTLGFHP